MSGGPVCATRHTNGDGLRADRRTGDRRRHRISAGDAHRDSNRDRIHSDFAYRPRTRAASSASAPRQNHDPEESWAREEVTLRCALYGGNTVRIPVGDDKSSTISRCRATKSWRSAATVAEELRREFGVESVALFGSVALGEAGPAATWIFWSSVARPYLSFSARGASAAVAGDPGCRRRSSRFDSPATPRDDPCRGAACRLSGSGTSALGRIVDAIHKMMRYPAGMSFEEFAEHDRTVDAVIRNFLIIGEAARHVVGAVKGRFPFSIQHALKAIDERRKARPCPPRQRHR